MMVHLGVQRALGESLLQFVQQAVGVKSRFRTGSGQKLMEKRVGYVGRLASCYRGPPSGPVWPPHTKFLTGPRIIGWRVSRSAHAGPLAGFVLDALEQALAERRPVKGGGLVHHSDGGSRYVCIRYTERLKDAGLESSVAASATHMTTRSPRRSTDFTRPR